jgi:hypothetical protein
VNPRNMSMTVGDLPEQVLSVASKRRVPSWTGWRSAYTGSVRVSSTATLLLSLMAAACHPPAPTLVSPIAISDDICAVVLQLEVRVVDGLGSPVTAAEIWRIDEPELEPPEPQRAQRLGLTDSEGKMSAPECYMESGDFQTWDPTAKPVRLLLMVIREGYGVRRLELKPPVSDVLASGNVLGIPPGQPFSYADLKTDPERMKRRYLLSTTVTLTPAGIASTR